MTSSIGSGSAAAETTGRLVMVLSDDVHGDESTINETLRSVASVTSIASTSDFADGAMSTAGLDQADATVFAELGIAVITADPAQIAAIEAAAEADPRVLSVEPEHIMYALTEVLPVGPNPTPDDLVDGQYVDGSTTTWGLVATQAHRCRFTGQQIKVAVLDTGFDLDHPDFAGRSITAQSFITDESAQDGHGHGTHCVGTSCGATNSEGRRYGVASGAELFVGKVLSNAGSGTDSSILAAMSWAITSGCRVISMSLGADLRTVSKAYEAVGRRALTAGTLVVAAAGNNARRRNGNFGFVGTPANSPSILAVAAVDARLGVADFSARTNPVSGGKIDIAGPGVAVYSSWPMPERTKSISGTSMATPHVAGLAALWSEATGDTGRALWQTMLRGARRMELPAIDVGVGLAQAPSTV